MGDGHSRERREGTQARIRELEAKVAEIRRTMPPGLDRLRAVAVAAGDLDIIDDLTAALARIAELERAGDNVQSLGQQALSWETKDGWIPNEIRDAYFRATKHWTAAKKGAAETSLHPCDKCKKGSVVLIKRDDGQLLCNACHSATPYPTKAAQSER